MGPAALSLIRRRLPPHLAVRVVFLAAGEARAYRRADWRGAFVVVECGEVELCGLSGATLRLRRGDSASLADLPLAFLYNPGPTIALLAAASRREPD